VGVEFGRCYESRVEVRIDELKVSFIDVENLKKNKRATGRLQDLADIENLGGEVLWVRPRLIKACTGATEVSFIIMANAARRPADAER
jgi:hypothetical protein